MESSRAGSAAGPSPSERIAAAYGLVPLPVEGGRFRRTWAGPPGPDGRPAGSVILALLTSEPGDFSAMHRLPVDEVWHFYRGDPLEVLLLGPDDAGRSVVLGGPQEDAAVQLVVPAGTWMGARVAPGGTWSLFGTSMAPGFTPASYEGGTAEELALRYPERAPLVRALCRPGAPTTMPADRTGGGLDD
ncbi:cupin domain-containing protein [Kitasatospora terrestris]|uniref:Cupin domain-containing protein n=1 Tax=Kitasatospora terrestris TaxID=258051 RepID=A0ABP9EKK4_9ACTN